MKAITTINKVVIFKNDTAKMVVDMNYRDGRLSIIGQLYEKNGRGWIDSSGGQNSEELVNLFGYDKKALDLFEIWQRWHLNNMNAVDELQERYLRALKATGWRYNYEDACERLEKLGILTHDGYRYGTAWKSEEVPQNILKQLEEL